MSPSDFDEKTRVTQVVRPPPGGGPGNATDCLVVIYTKEPTLLGKRFILEHNPTRVGRGADNHIVLDGDSVSRRHAHFESRGAAWLIVNDGSTNGTYCNDEQISREIILKNGDRVKIGPTIFKFLSGADVEAQYHEEIYRMTIMDGLTQIHNKRYLYEALEREIIRSRRHERDLVILLFDIDHFKRINDVHGHLAGDFVLRELARIVQARIRRDEVFARYGGEEFAIILPEKSLEEAATLGEAIRQKVSEHLFVFQADSIRVTISVGVALLQPGDRSAHDLIKRADERLYFAKNAGRNRISISGVEVGAALIPATQRSYHPVVDGQSLLEKVLKPLRHVHLLALEMDDEATILRRLGSETYRAWFGELLAEVDARLGESDALGTWSDRYVVVTVAADPPQALSSLLRGIMESWGAKAVPAEHQGVVRRGLNAASLTPQELESFGARSLDELCSRLLALPQETAAAVDDLPFPVAAPRAMASAHWTAYRRATSLLEAIDATLRFVVAIELATLRDSDDPELARRAAAVVASRARPGQPLSLGDWVNLLWRLADLIPRPSANVVLGVLGALGKGGPLRAAASEPLARAIHLRDMLARERGVSDSAHAEEASRLRELLDGFVDGLAPLMRLRLVSVAEIDGIGEDGSIEYSLYLHRGPAEHFRVIRETLPYRLSKGGLCYLLPEEGVGAPLLLSPLVFSGTCAICGRVEVSLADRLTFGPKGARVRIHGVTTNHEGTMEVPWHKPAQAFHAHVEKELEKEPDESQEITVAFQPKVVTTLLRKTEKPPPPRSNDLPDTIKLLGDEQLRSVANAAVRVGLEGERVALVSSLPSGLVTSLPTAPSPLGQLMSDLAKLNAIPRAADGTIPLEQWLFAAITLRGAFIEAAVFRRALDSLTAAAQPEGPPSAR